MARKATRKVLTATQLAAGATRATARRPKRKVTVNVTELFEDVKSFLDDLEDFPFDLSEEGDAVRQALAEAQAHPTDKAKRQVLADLVEELGMQMHDNLSTNPYVAYDLAERLSV